MKYRDKTRRLVGVSGVTHPPTSLRCSYLGAKLRYDLPGVGRGFTLIEIMIVLALMAIAVLLAAPIMTSGAGVQIRAATNMIAADLEYAKSMAISRGQNFSVVFDKNAESYRILDQNNDVIPHPVNIGFDYVVDFQNDGRLNKVNIADVNFNMTSRVQFGSLGSPDNGGTISLEARGMTATVMVEPLTGFISIGN